MPNRIDTTFSRLQASGKSAGLICYATAGYPDAATSAKLINSLPHWGADFIEIGMPFSDASADGSTIREASKVALKQGMNLNKLLQLAQDFRRTNSSTPLIIMGYYNPIYNYGPADFAAAATECGVDGLLIVDLPLEEETEITQHLDDNLYLIHLITPTTDGARLHKVSQQAKGFLYYVAVTGTTGSKTPELAEVQQHLSELQPTLPVAIGFGISEPSQVHSFGELGDAVVIGSALMRTLAGTAESANQAAKLSDLARQVQEYAAALSTTKRTN